MTTSNDAAAPVPGWYHADGDPADTMRYWDGITWQGEPRPIAAGPAHRPTVPAPAKTMPPGLEPGGPWQRIVGKVIDEFVIFVPLSALAVFLEYSSPGASQVVFMGGLVVLMGLYDLVLVGLFATTLGKAVMGLRVVGPTGELADWGVAAKRWALSLVVLAPLVGAPAAVVIGVVSLVFLFTDPRRQTVHDRVAGSFVVTTASLDRARAGDQHAANA